MEHLLVDPHFWVNIGLLLFLVVAGPKAWRALSGMLDQRAIRVKAMLDEAQKLRDEAQALLEDYQRRQRDAMSEAQDIVATAHDSAEQQRRDATAAIEANLARREKMALEKIAQAESQALADVRRAAIDIAAAATARLLAGNLDEARANALVDETIGQIEKKLH